MHKAAIEKLSEEDGTELAIVLASLERQTSDVAEDFSPGGRGMELLLEEVEAAIDQEDFTRLR